MKPLPVSFMEIEAVGDTLRIRPQANLSEFQYQHIEESVGQVLRMLADSAIRHVVIDFRHTAHFGSSAVEALIRIGQEVKRRSGTMTLENLSNSEREVLEILHIGKLWTIREAASTQP